MDTMKTALDITLISLFYDFTENQNLAEVIGALVHGSGCSAFSSARVTFQSDWESYEPEYGLFLPDTVLIGASGYSLSLPDGQDLDYPIGYQEFCDRFDAWIGHYGLFSERRTNHALIRKLRDSFGVPSWRDLSRPSRLGEDPEVAALRGQARQAMNAATRLNPSGNLVEGVSPDGRIFQGYLHYSKPHCVYQIAPLLPEDGHIHPPPPDMRDAIPHD